MERLGWRGEEVTKLVIAMPTTKGAIQCGMRLVINERQPA